MAAWDCHAGCSVSARHVKFLLLATTSFQDLESRNIKPHAPTSWLPTSLLRFLFPPTSPTANPDFLRHVDRHRSPPESPAAEHHALDAGSRGSRRLPAQQCRLCRQPMGPPSSGAADGPAHQGEELSPCANDISAARCGVVFPCVSFFSVLCSIPLPPSSILSLLAFFIYPCITDALFLQPHTLTRLPPPPPRRPARPHTPQAALCTQTAARRATSARAPTRARRAGH
jgi:hypothetical protein